jgi:hypothetical protein
MHQTARSYQ